jgi:signal transduction histidine kinase
VYFAPVTKLHEPASDEPPPVADWSPATSRLIIDIASAAAGERELDQILRETLDRLRTEIPLTGGSIALVQADNLVIRAAVGPFADEALGQRVRRGASLSWQVVETLQPCVLPDVRTSAAVSVGPKAREAMRSWLAVPIVRRGLGIGLVEIDSTLPDAFSPADMRLLETIVRVLSGPVELAAHYAAEQRAAELREAFVGVISHELRTPITTIYGLSKMLRQRGTSLDPEVMVSTIEDVEAEADRLQRLVEDLLVLSRAERGAVDIDGEPITLARVLARVVEAERARMPGRVIELEVRGELPLVLGEETYVEQVVRNLLTNAAKYADPATPIRVVATAADDEVTVRVLDEGIGIAVGDTDRVFELFYRSSSATRMAGGAGIGLFVCRQLVEAMSGRIWAAPRSPVGTEVGFGLPIHRPLEGDS